jgi:hypothetical protein
LFTTEAVFEKRRLLHRLDFFATKPQKACLKGINQTLELVMVLTYWFESLDMR